MFFTEAISAAVARSVGTALIHGATVLRGSMDLRSYDRLFPNQDVLPEGGFGNLIAAPLQGRRRKDGLAAFLDLATLEPYEDQWAFLSTLDRLSPGDAARLARRAKRAVVGAEVAALSRSDATRVHPPLPVVVHAELGAPLSLDATQLTPAALSTFKHAASMANPKFYELQRLRKSTWDTPRFVRGYDLTVDECHHLAAAAYDHSVKRMAAQFWLGLTATPTRRDGLGELVTWQLGPVRHTITHEPPRNDDRGTLLEALSTNAGPRRLLYVHETGFEFRADDADSSAPSAIAEAHRALAVDEARNTQVVADVTAALRRGRNCLVLTRRVAHVESLTAALASHGRQALVLQGNMSTSDRRATVRLLTDAKAGDGVLVVGTTPFIGEGFDAPALDTLFLAAPVSYDGLLVQCAGRVIRAAPGKEVAEVHDYHDRAVPILAASLQRRLPGYRALGFTRA
nr:hypothetical protein GCM10020063_084920 [Dactylosporangium thailandense]